MEINPIRTPKQANDLVQLQADVWEMDYAEVVPAHLLIAIAKNGGLLLGAYDGGTIIGFTAGWLGTIEAPGSLQRTTESIKLVSHMTGVLPAYRDQRVGYRLKLAQREWALERGLELITWTYDPLESRNAYLNLRRLGVTCQTYVRDAYGELTDRMSAGIVADRFEVEWRITSERVKQRLVAAAHGVSKLTRASVEAPVLNPATQGPDGQPRPAERSAALSEDCVLIEIPANMQAIRRTDLALGAAWRYHTRGLFESAFRAGYRVVDLIFERDSSFSRSFYVLEKAELEHRNED